LDDPNLRNAREVASLLLKTDIDTIFDTEGPWVLTGVSATG